MYSADETVRIQIRPPGQLSTLIPQSPSNDTSAGLKSIQRSLSTVHETEKERKQNELVRTRKSALFVKLKVGYDELASKQDEALAPGPTGS